MPGDPVLTLADLERPPDGSASLAVLGHPIGHSLSPPMHNAALAELARSDASYSRWRYVRIDVLPEDLPRALGLLHAARFRGVNLTVPHKVIAFGRVAAVDPAARAAGAVNTLVREEAGWRGFNTDGYGLSMGIRESLGRGLEGANLLILGAGGAARGAAAECLARGCAGLWIVNRTPTNMETLLASLRPLAGGIRLVGLRQNERLGLPPGAFVINATSAGLRADDPSPFDLSMLQGPTGVYDMIYAPPVTALLRQAADLGIPRSNGLSMLVHQGAKSLELWTGVPASRTAPVMHAAIAEAGGGRR